MTFRADRDGWMRYRGSGRRGRTSNAHAGVVDLGFAIEALTRARQALETVASGGLDRKQRDQVRAELHAQGELAMRFTKGVLRAAGRKPKVAPVVRVSRQLTLL